MPKMEAKNMKCNSERKGKKRAKMSIAIGLGGDIGGLVVLSGALALAGFFATFIVKRHKTMAYSNGKRALKSSKYMPKKDQHDYENQGLRFLLQTSTTTARSNYSDHEDSSTMSDNEDEILTETDDGLEIQNIMVPDSSEKEITELSDDDLCLGQDDCNALEEIPIESEDTHLVEKDVDEESVVSVDVNEKGSMDFHANAICSAEIVEDTMPELQTHETQSIHKEVKTAIADNYKHFISDSDFNNHVAEKNMIVNVQSSQYFTVRVWISSMLIVAMLFLSLAQVYDKVVPVILY